MTWQEGYLIQKGKHVTLYDSESAVMTLWNLPISRQATSGLSDPPINKWPQTKNKHKPPCLKIKTKLLDDVIWASWNRPALPFSSATISVFTQVTSETGKPKVKRPLDRMSHFSILIWHVNCDSGAHPSYMCWYSYVCWYVYTHQMNATVDCYHVMEFTEKCWLQEVLERHN